MNIYFLLFLLYKYKYIKQTSPHGGEFNSRKENLKCSEEPQDFQEDF